MINIIKEEIEIEEALSSRIKIILGGKAAFIK